MGNGVHILFGAWWTDDTSIGKGAHEMDQGYIRHGEVVEYVLICRRRPLLTSGRPGYKA